MKKLTLIFTIILLISCQVNEEIREQVGAIGDEAMVVSAHPIATKAGLEILRKGGNVFDAAVTTHFMLAVVYPRAGNIGGGGFA
ncbi:MAG: gamma-glutamyltransferase, partial [Cyclobacteriaceae bacterium]